VEALDGLLARRQDLVPVLDDLVGGQPPARTPEVHRTAARMEPEPDTPRCLHLDLQEIPRAAGEDVVVVGRGGAAGEGEGSAPGAGGGVLGLLVDERPHRVELDEPLEEGRLLGEAAGRPAVEVVMAVHEAQRDQAPAPVDADRPAAVLLGRGTGVDGHDAVVLDDEVAGEVFGAAGIQDGDGAVLDGEAREVHAQSILAAARRTASRIFS
jgi:hypothetical protein